MERVPAWPELLAAEFDAANSQPYVLGSHDCLRFTCRCIEVMTGVDFWPRFNGYKTKRQALATIARIAPSLAEAVTLVLERDMLRPLQAQRGDVVLYRDDAGEHLGVCAGATVAVLGETGLVYKGLDDAGVIGAWRIG